MQIEALQSGFHSVMLKRCVSPTGTVLGEKDFPCVWQEAERTAKTDSFDPMTPLLRDLKGNK